MAAMSTFCIKEVFVVVLLQSRSVVGYLLKCKGKRKNGMPVSFYTLKPTDVLTL